MKRKCILKRFLCFCMAAVLACGIPVSTASAKNGYYDGDYFQDRQENATDYSYKGLQGATEWSEYTSPDGLYGITHTFFNVHLNDCIYPKNSGRGQRYEFEGETFYLNVSTPVNYARIAAREEITCSVQFMVKWEGSNSDSLFLIDEGSRRYNGRSPYNAPATSGYGKKAIRAFWDCLMKELAKEDLHIDNFILGNEVNMPHAYHYSGTSDPWEVTRKYAISFYDMYQIVRRYSDSARCSVCIDHSWNQDDEGRGIAARDFLDKFDAQIRRYSSNVDWCVSAHLYPALLWDARIWAEHHAGAVGYELTTNSYDSPFVDGSNLWVMTNYIKEQFGEEHRVMLTEQGFTQENGERVQAAALACSYYAAKYDPMVDCFILHAANDGRGMDFYGNSVSYNFELLSLAEQVYRRIGRDNAEDQKWIASVCLPVIGVNSWEEIIPSYGGRPTPPTPAVDYSAVFNAQYYYDNNPDLAYMGRNEKALRQHFINYGMAEGRQGSAEFNLAVYRQYNPDLAAVYGNDNKRYYMHYIETGKSEGRIASYAEHVNLLEQYAPIFGVDYYYNNNPDLAAGFGYNDIALFNHFLNHGMDEGRRGSDEFDPGYYAESNGDLFSAFGGNYKNYYMHYLYHGREEGRPGNRSAGAFAEGYSLVYDTVYYADHNPDLRGAWGYNERALLNHFINHGMDEGRPASANFDLAMYKAYNNDLTAAFGDNNKSYYMHYIEAGKSEGRIASYAEHANLLGQYAPIFKVDYYYENNPDLAGFGYNDVALFNHFLNHGMNEGRRGSEEFDLGYYVESNGDLFSAFGGDYKNYYLHYLYHGREEGRPGNRNAGVSAEDYSLVYDTAYYADYNPDLKEAWGYDEGMLLDHFINHGMSEGRIASASFNVHVYRDSNPDLGYLGDNWAAYFEHYINHGYAEYRPCY